MAYVSKINGYTIKDTEAHTKIAALETTTATHTSNISSLQTAVANAGKIDNVQIDGTNLAISSKAVNIATDGGYNANSNKVATVKTVTDKIAAVVASAPASYDTLKEIADYIASDTTGAAQMSNNITKNATDIDNLETVVDSLSLEETYNSADQSLELELGNGGTSVSGTKNAKWIALKAPASTSSGTVFNLDDDPALLLVGAYDTSSDTFKKATMFIPSFSEFTDGVPPETEIPFPFDGETTNSFTMNYNPSTKNFTLYKSSNFAATRLILSVILVKFPS